VEAPLAAYLVPRDALRSWRGGFDHWSVGRSCRRCAYVLIGSPQLQVGPIHHRP